MKTTALSLVSSLVLSTLCVCTPGAEGQDPQVGARTGPYMGETPPGLTPRLFAPGIVSTPERWEHSITFTAEATEIYFTRALARRNGVFSARLEGAGWTRPEEAAFSSGFDTMLPHLSSDGRRLFVNSERPRSGSTDLTTGLWIMDRAEGGEWGEPWFHSVSMAPSTARNGNLFVTDLGTPGGDVVVYAPAGEGYAPARSFEGAALTPRCGSGHNTIAPDESYILFEGREPEGHGGWDLLVCFRHPDGTWSGPRNLGNGVNTPGDDWVTSVSPDGEFIFYTSDGDIYWVSARILDRLREEGLGSAPAENPGPGPAAPASRQAPAFVKTPQTFERLGATDVFLEDLDADGDVDAVISSAGTSLVLLNDGQAEFTETLRLRTVHGLTVGDIDLDGDGDLVLAPQGAGERRCDLYLNDGRAGFERVESDLCDSGEPLMLGLRLVDLDGDGDPDAVNSRPNGFGIGWLNDGRGRFRRSGAAMPIHASFGDLNGDGYNDAVSRESEREAPCDVSRRTCGEGGWVLREGEVGIRVYLNDRSGRFRDHAFLPLPSLVSPGGQLSRLLDLDGDGDLDLINTDGPQQSSPVSIFWNDGAGGLTEAAVGLPTVTNGRIGAGDLNNDGYVDLVITDWEGPAQIWLGDGAGGFRDSGVRVGEEFGCQGVGVADLDGDGDQDLFITDYKRPGTSVWLSQLGQGSP